MFHALSTLLPGGVCFFRPLTVAPSSACLAVGLPCIAFMAKWRLSHVPRDYLNGQLRCGLDAGGSTIPCSDVNTLHPGHACKHWETCISPVNSRRVEAPSDGASTTIHIISPYCPALALNRMEFPEGFSCRHLNPIRYIVSGLCTEYTARTQHAA